MSDFDAVASDAAVGVPPIPARMLNEFAYCPRLFHLEWVQGEWADNRYTAEGTWGHRCVDAKSVAATPDPEAEGDPPPQTSQVRLESDELGLIAVIDVLERSGDSAVPVDHKRGAPPKGGPWPPERVQLAVQALLLREGGLHCDEGMLYYTGARRRVRVVIDDELVAETRRVIAEARACAAVALAPPPLVDSPKCPGCSLVGICLPDETNAVAGRHAPDVPVRRLQPSKDGTRPLYVSDPGARVGKSGDRLVVKRLEGEPVEVRTMDVSQVCLFGNVQMSSQAVRDVVRRGVPIAHFSYGGWLDAVTTGPWGKNVQLRREQYAFGDDAERSLGVARDVVAAKLRNQRTLLRRNHADAPQATLREIERCATSAGRAGSAETLLGLEGAGARAYFAAFSGMLKSDAHGFDFTTRNRRPPRDPVNALLSFAYAMLVKDLTATLTMVGLDPYWGFFHRPRFGKPALALDLAEEFRPIVADSVVVNVLNNGEVTTGHFVRREGACALDGNGRKRFLAAYERRMSQTIRHSALGYSASYRRIFEVQARLLARCMTGETDHYIPFRTR